MDMPRASGPSYFWSCAGANLVIALIYYGLAELSRQLASTPNAVTSVWPSDGLAIGATLLYGNWILPGVCLGSFLANIQAFWNLHNWQGLLISVFSVLGIAGGTTLGTWLGTFLLCRAIRQRYPFNRVSDTIKFLVYAGLIGPMMNATVGVAMLVFAHKAPWSAYGDVWLIWWISNVAGIFILTPVLLSWSHWIQLQHFSSNPKRFMSQIRMRLVVSKEKGVEALVLAGFTFFIGKASFWDKQPLAYMLMPLLVWAAFRLGQPGTTLIMFLTATIAIIGTVRGLGTFAAAELNQSLIGLQSFIAVVVFTSLVLVAVLAEQMEAESRLRNAFTELQVANKELATLNTALASANQELVEREREKAILLEITQASAQINDTQSLFAVLYARIQPIFHFDTASVVVLEDDSTAYCVLYHQHNSSFNEFFANKIPLAGTPLEEGFSDQLPDFHVVDVDEWLDRYPQYEGLRKAKQVGYTHIVSGRFYKAGKRLGLVELIYRTPPKFDEAFGKLFENFVQQVAVAVANILAHAEILVQKEALLQAEQARVAELKTNQALKNSLDRLAANPDLNAFLGHVLLEIVQQFQIELGYLFLYDARSQTLPLHLHIQHGQVQQPQELEVIEPFRCPVLADLPIWETLLQTRQPFVITHETTAQYMFRGTLEWQTQQQGHQTGINLLLTLQDEPIGLLALVSTRRSFTPEELELSQALANQATLAIQLTRLAEEAKQAAIAREQGKAATERTAELVKANAALKNSLDRLATEPNLDTFLGHVLLEITQQLQTNAGYMFFYDLPSHTLQLHIGVESGKVLPKQELQDIEPSLEPIPADINRAWEIIVQARQPIEFDIYPGHPESFPGTLEWHRQRGHQTAVCLPLILGDTPLGFLGVAFNHKSRLTPEEFELAQALAHQATLAIQLTRLAEQANLEAAQSILLEERNRMAREIHDTLAQGFTGILVHLEATKRKLGLNKPDEAQTHLLHAGNLARDGLSEARRSVWALRPEVLESYDLPNALRHLAQQMTADTTVRTQFWIEGTPCVLSAEIEMNLLRIGQEALTNALKHGHAQTVRFELLFEAGAVHLKIIDDGQGFDETQQIYSSGFGLIGMQERSQRLGGQITITSRVGVGTEISVTLPTP